MRVRDSHRAGIDPKNSPGGIAELENFARHALDGEVLVDRAEEGLARLEHHPVIGVVRNRAAGGQRKESRAAAPANAMVHRVVMDQRGPAAAASAEPLGQHFQHPGELEARQVAISIRAADQREEFLFFPVFRRGAGDDLLRENIERFLRYLKAVQLTPAHTTQRGHALDQLVATQRKQPALRHTAALVLRPADALKQRGNRTGRSELAHQVHRANVNAQFQRGGGDQRLEFAPFQPVLRLETQFRRETAVMGRSLVRSQPLAQMARDGFRQPPRVDEHQRRSVLLDQFRQPMINLRPDLIRHHCFERRAGQFDGQVQFPLVARVDDCAGRPARLPPRFSLAGISPILTRALRP